MNVLYLATAGLLLAVAPADGGPADSPPALAPETARPPVRSILQQDGVAQPGATTRSAAALREEIRQLKQRIQVLEGHLAAIEGRQPYGTTQPVNGKLVLDNQTPNSHWVSVNGDLYPVAPGRTEIVIRVNRATIYLPYHEGPKQWDLDRWRWNGQNYELLLTIGYREPVAQAILGSYPATGGTWR
jgi:hypothetical protein